jgi:hypothetical protein
VATSCPPFFLPVSSLSLFFVPSKLPSLLSNFSLCLLPLLLPLSCALSLPYILFPDSHRSSGQAITRNFFFFPPAEQFKKAGNKFIESPNLGISLHQSGQKRIKKIHAISASGLPLHLHPGGSSRGPRGGLFFFRALVESPNYFQEFVDSREGHIVVKGESRGEASKHKKNFSGDWN